MLLSDVKRILQLLSSWRGWCNTLMHFNAFPGSASSINLGTFAVITMPGVSQEYLCVWVNCFTHPWSNDKWNPPNLQLHALHATTSVRAAKGSILSKQSLKAHFGFIVEKGLLRSTFTRETATQHLTNSSGALTRNVISVRGISAQATQGSRKHLKLEEIERHGRCSKISGLWSEMIWSPPCHSPGGRAHLVPADPRICREAPNLLWRRTPAASPEEP